VPDGVQAIVAFAVLSCYGLAQTGSPQAKSEPVSLAKGGQEWVEETLRGLSLEEKVGQMLQVRSYADYQSVEAGEMVSGTILLWGEKR
jgi:hypothetical protein